MPDDRSGAPRRPRTPGTNGHHLSEMPTAELRFDDLRDEPIDLVAVQADDELINALASGMAVSSPGIGGYDVDDQVAALLAAWKAEVEAEPAPPLVDVEIAAARVRAASRPTSRRLRMVAPLAAAAVVVLSVGGLGYNAGVTAGPGDGLAWEIAKVVDGERVESVLAAERVEVLIAEAKDALTRGEPEQAAQALAAAAQDLQAVRPEENAADLAEVQSFLEAKAAETPPGVPVQVDAPLASDPTRPVPAGVRPAPLPPSAPALVAPATTTPPAPPPPAPGTGTGSVSQPVPAPPAPGPGSSPAVVPPPPVSSAAPVPPSSVTPTSPPPPPTSSPAPAAEVPVPDGGLGSAPPAAGTPSASGSGTSGPTPSS